ncbi:MAG: methylated-DNA--[protein]-cysteine S-methyltransferase [Alphaproteobacteria bacterium]|nr:methylated-DNA--[protein]-cysteine S-methyltransferase [Alphaproteobacteria bacterium]
MKHVAEKYVTDYAMMDSPVGSLLIGGHVGNVFLIGFPSGCYAVAPDGTWPRDDTLYPDAMHQLEDYFAGRRRVFDFPMRMVGTDFQKTVWSALIEIPSGETRTYAAIASSIGRPNAIRAVGAANGANPLAIAVPCHRLLGSNGSLIKFGGGLPVKQYLLDLESKQTTA